MVGYYYLGCIADSEALQGRHASEDAEVSMLSELLPKSSQHLEYDMRLRLVLPRKHFRVLEVMAFMHAGVVMKQASSNNTH